MSDKGDKKDAVVIGVTLSTQIITASLTMIAVIGGFSAFIIDKRIIGWWYYLVIGCAFISFIVSIFFGGKGIDQARKDGFNGNWDINSTKKKFNYQSISAFLGVLFFSISIFVGDDKNDELKIKALEINQLKKTDSIQKVKIDSLSRNTIKYQNKLDSLEKMAKMYSIQPKNQEK